MRACGLRHCPAHPLRWAVAKHPYRRLETSSKPVLSPPSTVTAVAGWKDQKRDQEAQLSSIQFHPYCIAKLQKNHVTTPASGHWGRNRFQQDQVKAEHSAGEDNFLFLVWSPKERGYDKH